MPQRTPDDYLYGDLRGSPRESVDCGPEPIVQPRLERNLRTVFDTKRTDVCAQYFAPKNPGAGNRLTVSQYQQLWLAVYQTKTATPSHAR
jgi:hypothetical protein